MTRVERKSVPLPLEYRIRGAISALNLTTKTFNIGSQRISYQFQAAPAGLADGAIVRIRVNTLKSGGVWEATRLREGSNRPDDNTHTRVEGLVNAFTSTAQFSVNGIAVATNSGTSFTPNPPVFNTGVRVEVEGTMAGNTLVASKVEIEDSGGNTEFDLRGPIEALTTTTLTVRGQTVTYGPGVIYEPQGKLATDLGVGLDVEVRATLFNGTQLQASRIKFK